MVTLNSNMEFFLRISNFLHENKNRSMSGKRQYAKWNYAVEDKENEKETKLKVVYFGKNLR